MVTASDDAFLPVALFVSRVRDMSLRRHRASARASKRASLAAFLSRTSLEMIGSSLQGSMSAHSGSSSLSLLARSAGGDIGVDFTVSVIFSSSLSLLVRSRIGDFGVECTVSLVVSSSLSLPVRSRSGFDCAVAMIFARCEGLVWTPVRDVVHRSLRVKFAYVGRHRQRN